MFIASMVRDGSGTATQVLRHTAKVRVDLPGTVQKIGPNYPRNAQYAGKYLKLDSEEYLRTNALNQYTKYKELAKKYPEEIYYDKDGCPDFKKYSRIDIKVERLTGKSDYKDFDLADKAARRFEQNFVRSETETWHHHQDGITMQLVPKDLHNSIPHTGGAALLRYNQKKE